MNKNIIRNNWYGLLIALLVGSLSAHANDITIKQPTGDIAEKGLLKIGTATETATADAGTSVTVTVVPADDKMLSSATLQVKAYTTGNQAEVRTRSGEPNYVGDVTVTASTTTAGEFTFTMPTNYAVEVSVTAIEEVAVTLDPASYNVTGSAIDPTVKFGEDVKTKGTDYTITYGTMGNINPHSAVTTTITGIGTYWGIVSNLTFAITGGAAQDMGTGNTEGTIYATLQAALDGVASGNTVKLLADVTEAVTVARSGEESVTLDLNNHIINANGVENAIAITAGTLTIVDNATNPTTRYWKKNENNYWEDPKTAIDTDHPEAFKTVGGCITGGNVSSEEGGGAGIRVSGTSANNAVLIFNSGNVVGNYAALRAGGGIYVGAHGIATISDKAVVCGNAANWGGGIRIFNGQLTLNSGTKITNNHGIANDDKGSGGGVSLFDVGTLNLSGQVTIKDNTNTNETTSCNLWINKAATITGALTGSNIGVTLQSTTGTFTSGYNTNNGGVDPTTYFHSDIADPITVLHELDDDDEVQIYRYSGTDGNIDWVYDRGTTTLTLSKNSNATSGVMTHYLPENLVPDAPWLPFHKTITTLIVNSGVTTIGDGCCSKKGVSFSSLSTVTLQEGIVSIGQCSFRDCNSLSTINLPTTLTSIDKWAFLRSGLTSIVIPANVSTINQSAFQNCTNLVSFVLLRTSATLTTLGTSAFEGCNANFKIYVPNSKAAAGSGYKTASNWKKYSSKINGWTYEMTGTNTTVNLAAAETDYTGSNIKPTISSVKITGSANIVSGGSQLLNLTHTFSNATVPSAAYTAEYAVNTASPAYSSAQPNAVNKYLVRVKGGVANQDYSGTSSAADFEIKRNLATDGIVLDGTRKWASYYASENLALPDGVTAYKVTGYNNTSVTISENIGYIPANNGVLLYSENAIAAANLKASAYTGDPTDIGTNLLKGAVTTTTMDATGTNYILYNNSFVLADGTSLGAKRCYINIPASSTSAARMLTIKGGDGTTGLSEEIIVNSEEPDDAVWYDLQGRKLEGVPTTKGLYIRNGKKVVIK